MRQGGILFWILEFIAHFIMMRQVFSNVLFYLEIVNKMRQVSITISEFTHSIKQSCGRCDIKFIWQSTVLGFQIVSNLYWKMWKTVVKAYKLLKSLSMKPWGSSKGILWIHCFSLPDEVGENFFSFSVYFLEF